MELTVAPWHVFTESTQRSRPFRARLYRGESQQNGGAYTSHVTSLCFRVRPKPKQTVTTRISSDVSNRCHVITMRWSNGVVTFSILRDLSCAWKKQTWRPFCTSLRRQHSSAARCNTAKVISRRSASKNRNVPIPLLFPSQLASVALPG